MASGWRMARLLLFHLWLAVVASPMAAFAGEVKLGDDIATGIQTSAEFDVRPFGYRVTWINWDSYFRESELRLGDRILGVNGERYTREAHNLGYAIGNHGENRYWADRGAKDGDPVTLIVEREARRSRSPVASWPTASTSTTTGGRRSVWGPDRLLPEVDENGNRVFDSSWGLAPGQDRAQAGFVAVHSGRQLGTHRVQQPHGSRPTSRTRADRLSGREYPSQFAETMRATGSACATTSMARPSRRTRSTTAPARTSCARSPGLCRARDRRAQAALADLETCLRAT